MANDYTLLLYLCAKLSIRVNFKNSYAMALFCLYITLFIYLFLCCGFCSGMIVRKIVQILTPLVASLKTISIVTEKIKIAPFQLRDIFLKSSFS